MTQLYIRPFISPMHERPSSYDQRTVNDSFLLRDSQKTDAYSTHYRPQERSIWEPRSPMSEHKKEPFAAPPPKAGETYSKRPEISQNPTREQLPPLSSLFGSSSAHQSRATQSPYSDRPSPVFPAVSPMDGRHLATPSHPDRPYDTSYFQRPVAAPQYSYNSRPEAVERVGFPAPPRPAQSGARPDSPRYESQPGSTEVTRPQHLSGWSARSQASAPEYFASDTSSSFKPRSEHRPHPSQSLRPEPDSWPTYRDPVHSTNVVPNYPPTPASTVAGEPSTIYSSKDGLGPKIWTGTQFLPRFVRQAEVLGEGMCYFYDDGTHCKTVIDGEVVNAHWGVTKAGKPRKRLAIACITCREKKIKCDPDYPRCVQCEKFGRICKFKNAPRGGQGSPNTPPADPEDLTPRPVSSRTENETFQVEERENSQSLSPRQTLPRATPDSDVRPSKRQRTGYTDFTPVASEASPRHPVLEPTSPSNPWLETLGNSPTCHATLRDWQVDPYTTHPALVTELLAVFFQHIPQTGYCMFPERPFTAWVLSGADKSLDDLMLLYAILALGTVFFPQSEHKVLGAHFASISRYACTNRHLTLQLVQARMILALYYSATNAKMLIKGEKYACEACVRGHRVSDCQHDWRPLQHINKKGRPLTQCPHNQYDSWDACGGSIRAASGLRLNVEFEKSEDAYLTTFPYGLNRHGYAECRRRTFWCCYLMDRFNGFCSGYLSVFHPEDVFLRLPCDAESFESQTEVQNPYFDPSTPPVQNTNCTIDSMGYLINICTIWGEVMANVYRTTQRVIPTTSNATFTTFYETTTQRLRAWKESLPTRYQFSAESLKSAADSGKLGTFMIMYAVYHTTAMKLNRYMKHSTLSASQTAHHVALAQEHAETLLVRLDALAAQRTSLPSPLSPREQAAPVNKFSSPFVGYSIVSAVDILTAKVSLSTLSTRLSSFSGAQSILAELAVSWQIAKTQQALVLQRISDLAELTTREDEQGGAGAIGFHVGSKSGVGREVREGVFVSKEPIEKTFPREFDCVYA